MKYTSIKHMLTTALLVFLSLCFSVSSKGTDYGSSTRIWHESLGTPPYGYYVLESTVTSYSFVHYLPSDYEEDISVVWDEMATQIRSVPELSSWVTLTDLSWNSNYSGIIFSLSFTENTGTSSRSITFGTPSCSTVTMIVQNGRSDTDEDTDTGPDTGDGNVPGGDDDGVAAEPTDYTEGLNMSDSHNWIFTALVGDDDSAVRSLTYYDGLGYPSHDVQVNGSGNCTSDLVTHHVYDYLHRETRTYLPYPKASNLGGYDSSGVQGQDSWYKSRFDIMDPSAYAWVGSRYENSSEGRLLGTTMPGFVYHEYGRESTCSYRGNVSGEVFLLDVDFSSGSVTVSGHYQPSTLSCVTSTDEDGRQKSVFKDLDARVVLERSLVSCGASGNEYADTYYAYDLLGRLSLVISPLGSALLSVGTVIPFPSIDAEDRSPLQSYCYGYRYDGRNRVVEKVIPDASAVYFVYDSGDRPVMVQDGNLRAVGKWRTTEYDAIGRSIRERIVPTLLTRSSLQSSFTSGTYPTVYTSGSGELLIERAYDVYPSSMASSLSFLDVPGVTSVGDSTSHDPRSLGLLTYEKIAVLDGGGMVERSYYYDYRGNVVQSVELRPGNRTLRISSRYDRQGRLLSREDRHVVSGASPPVTDVLSTAFNYDSSGRLTREYMTLERNGQNAYARVEYSYDDLGRVSGRRYDDLEYSPDETLEYDLQGRLVRQNLYVYDYDAFTSVLHYDDSVNGAVPQYGGNISSWEWNLRSYAFNYDGLSRLTGAEQYESDALENEFTFSKDDTFADSVYTEIVYRDAIESFVLDSDDSCHFYILARPPYWDKGEPVDVPGEMTRIYARDDLGNLLFPFFDDNGLKPQYYKVIISNGVVGLDYGVDFCGKNCDEYFEYEARPISYALPRRFSK